MEDITSNLFGDPATFGGKNTNASVEIFGKVTDEIFSTKRIRLKTDLNEKQIVAFSRATVFANKYHRTLLKGLIKNVSEYSISKGRKGRKEFENIAKANLGLSKEDDAPSIPRRLFGG